MQHFLNKAWFCKIACISKLFTPTCKYFYTDISVISVTFCNSAKSSKRYLMSKTWNGESIYWRTLRKLCWSADANSSAETWLLQTIASSLIRFCFNFLKVLKFCRRVKIGWACHWCCWVQTLSTTILLATLLWPQLPRCTNLYHCIEIPHKSSPLMIPQKLSKLVLSHKTSKLMMPNKKIISSKECKTDSIRFGRLETSSSKV